MVYCRRSASFVPSYSHPIRHIVPSRSLSCQHSHTRPLLPFVPHTRIHLDLIWIPILNQLPVLLTLAYYDCIRLLYFSIVVVFARHKLPLLPPDLTLSTRRKSFRGYPSSVIPSPRRSGGHIATCLLYDFLLPIHEKKGGVDQ